MPTGIYRRIKHWKHSEETKRKMSLARKGKPCSHNALKIWQKNNGSWNKGKHLPKWLREKISRIKKSKNLIGSKSITWKGGKFKHSEGYIMVYQPNHPFTTKQKYIFEHRLVMEKHLGRFLLPTEIIHHINRLRTDNRIENLMLFNNKAEHRRIHIIKKNH